MEKHHARCILLNTGWSGGSYGTGQRMKLSVTRALLNAALNGELDGVETETQPILKLKMPKSCPGVDSKILNPRNTWADKDGYDATATKLRDMFRDNRSEEHTSELQSLMRNSYAVFCLKKKT